MKQQTAVQWLERQIEFDMSWTEIMGLIRQAKQMERNQIIDAVGVGSQFDRDYLYGYHDKAEQYYTQTYGE